NYTGERVTYGYDSAGVARSMLFSDGSSTRDLYKATTVDAFGRLRAANFSGATYAANYDDIGRRLLKQVTVTSAKAARSLGFPSYDALGRELQRTETGANATPTTFTSEYDSLGRLATSLSSGGPTPNNWSFSYDPLGNIKSLYDAVNPSGAASMS